MERGHSGSLSVARFDASERRRIEMSSQWKLERRATEQEKALQLRAIMGPHENESYVDWPILAESERWEEEHRDGRAFLGMFWGFLLMSGCVLAIYGICMIPWHEFVENMLWFWNVAGGGPWDSGAK